MDIEYKSKVKRFSIHKASKGEGEREAQNMSENKKNPLQREEAVGK